MACRSFLVPVLVALMLARLAGSAAAADLARAELAPADLERQAGTAFHNGEFQRAAQLAKTAGTAQGSAMAAWAELVHGKFVAPPEARMQEIRQAEEDARQAIMIDGTTIQGHLALVVALGFIGREEGGLAAHFDGTAREAKQHIDRVLALAPGNAWANALLGGWNLEIVYDGGALGREVYGASIEQGMEAYARALAVDPANGAIAYQYALELLALGGKGRAEMAKQLLVGIVGRIPADALDGLVKARAATVLGALDSHDEDRLSRLVHDELGGSG